MSRDLDELWLELLAHNPTAEELALIIKRKPELRQRTLPLYLEREKKAEARRINLGEFVSKFPEIRAAAWNELLKNNIDARILSIIIRNVPELSQPAAEMLLDQTNNKPRHHVLMEIIHYVPAFSEKVGALLLESGGLYESFYVAIKVSVLREAAWQKLMSYGDINQALAWTIFYSSKLRSLAWDLLINRPPNMEQLIQIVCAQPLFRGDNELSVWQYMPKADPISEDMIFATWAVLRQQPLNLDDWVKIVCKAPEELADQAWIELQSKNIDNGQLYQIIFDNKKHRPEAWDRLKLQSPDDYLLKLIIGHMRDTATDISAEAQSMLTLMRPKSTILSEILGVSEEDSADEEEHLRLKMRLRDL